MKIVCPKCMYKAADAERVCPRCGTILLSARQRRDLIHKPQDEAENANGNGNGTGNFTARSSRRHSRQVPGDTMITTGVAPSLSPEHALRDALQYLESVDERPPRRRIYRGGGPEKERNVSRRWLMTIAATVLVAAGVLSVFLLEGSPPKSTSPVTSQTAATNPANAEIFQFNGAGASTTGPFTTPSAVLGQLPRDLQRIPRQTGHLHADALGQARRTVRLRHRDDRGVERRVLPRCRRDLHHLGQRSVILRLDGLGNELAHRTATAALVQDQVHEGMAVTRFRIRATGLILSEGRVLVHSADEPPVSTWALPGGGPEFQELSHETVVRELREELCVNVVVDRLVFVIEHTFRRREDGRPSHHIDFVYLVQLDDPEILARTEPWIAPGSESYGQLLYHWLPVDQVDEDPKLYPACLSELVRDRPPASPVHVAVRESG